MRENEKRGINPSMYTAPVTVFNTVSVEIDSQTGEPKDNASNKITTKPENNEDLPLRTNPLQATELLKLDPLIDKHDEMAATPSMQSLDSAATLSEFNDISSASTDTLDRYKNPQDVILGAPQERPPPPEYPTPCEIINAQTQQIHSIDPMYKALQKNHQTGQYDMANQHIPMSTFLPPQVMQQQYYQSNPNMPPQMMPNYQQQHYMSQNPSYLPPYPGQNQYPQSMQGQTQGQQSPQTPDQKSRSLERNQTQNIVQAYAARLNSLERTKISDVNAKVSRSNSLTRQLNSGPEMYPPPTTIRSASLERGPPPYGPKTGSLERKQNAPPPAYHPPAYGQPQPGSKGGSLERNQSAAIVDMMNRGFRGGSLERNSQGTFFNVNRSSSLERSIPYQPYRGPQMKKEEPFQEEIYDFGGINVKSCAAIALKKSIEKGLLPPSAMNQLTAQPTSPQPQQQDQPYSMPPMYTPQQQHRMWQNTPPPQRMGPFPPNMMGLMSPKAYQDHGTAQV